MAVIITQDTLTGAVQHRLHHRILPLLAATAIQRQRLAAIATLLQRLAAVQAIPPLRPEVDVVAEAVHTEAAEVVPVAVADNPQKYRRSRQLTETVSVNAPS